MKNIFFILCILMVSFNVKAQEYNCPVFVATTEKAMFQLIEQLIDSVIQADRYNVYKETSNFNMTFWDCIETEDTLMLAKRDCSEEILRRFPEYANQYKVFLSNKMPISFYHRLYNYYNKLIKNDNTYIKGEASHAIGFISDILIEKYESGALGKIDSLNAKDLIEQTLLSRITNSDILSDMRYYYNKGKGKYMTEKIRDALIDAIDSPYYPNSYLDFYMSRQDTAFFDITGIPEEFIKNYKPNPYRSYQELSEREYAYRLSYYHGYKQLSDYKYGGILSPGKAYLEEKKAGYLDTGYMDINSIAQYAYKSQDKLLIEHLIEFKKKHPDYPLKYF